ncbi:redox-regulated ATPase YchF [Candidatus Margulisiibacteriota bacterium]
MGFSIGIVGLPNVGKSTLFNAITKVGAPAENYPFCTVDPNIGIVTVPDERLAILSKMHGSKKTTPTAIEFVDIAGLVKGASKGEGLGNQFLGNIREVDAIAHVVRCFEDPNVVHVDGSIDPKRDIEVINLELILADLETIEKKCRGVEKKAATGDKESKIKYDVFKKLKDALEKNLPARAVVLSSAEKNVLKSEVQLLTSKPVLYVANIDEAELKKGTDEYINKVKELAKQEAAETIVICTKLETEIAELGDEEARAFMKEVGIESSGLEQLATASYKLLNLITFLTTGETETRAWTITSGAKAPQAAGVIHTDFEKGFIKAEVVAYPRLVEAGSWHNAVEKGWVRQEGKEYVFKDGDVVIFKFNV